MTTPITQYIAPLFLQGTKISKVQKAELQPHLQNWKVLSRSLGNFEPQELAAMLIMEINTKRREHIIERLYRAYIRKRREIEVHQIRAACVLAHEKGHA